ncbi:hypothetical protein Tco_1578640 [Tanacetum coccineum]
MLDRIGVLERDNMSLRGMLCVEKERVDSLRRHMMYAQEELRQIRMSRYYDRADFRRLETFAMRRLDAAKNHGPNMESRDEHEDDNGDDNGNGNRDGGGHGNGNGMGGGNGNRHPNMNVGGVVPVTRECTYQDFVKCRPLNFKGTKGVVGLTRCFEKIVTVFHISNCLQKYQVKYATCTLQNNALTWWNSHKRTVEIDATYAMTWKALMKLMKKNLTR